MTDAEKQLIRQQLAKYQITNRMGFVRWMIAIFKAGK